MYDEINNKGFEGDTVLNGLAEFLRNLLVSRDARVVMLLEVAEDFKQRYIQTAQKVNPGYIISALNVLNEAEINFKQARNKRLHVELTIIKLCYLQQALELVETDGGVTKKKQLDGAKTVAFKALPIRKIKEPKQVESIKPLPDQPAARLIIEEPVEPVRPVVNNYQSQPVSATTQEVKTEPKPQTSTSSFSSLNKIRQQIAKQNQQGSVEVKPLTEEELHAAWGLFIQQLRDKAKHSAVTNFKAAILDIVDNNNITITTQGEIHKGFIELERSDLTDFLQGHFSNRNLMYQLIVEERKEEVTETEKPLTRKQLYLRMIGEYPMVKELKDRLKLELE